MSSDKRAAYRVAHRDEMTNEHACWMCGVPVWEGHNLHMDHVQPIARGGVHCADNLRPACRSCNQSKGARDWQGEEASA